MLHHVQRTILDTLAIVESAPYSKLKPADMDGNSFTYHLKQLLTFKYIERTTVNDYKLTQLGKTYIVHRYENPATEAHSIFLIVLKVGDKWLLRKRLVQPHIGKIGFVHGEPRYDEPVITTAEKRLLEKTGIHAYLSIKASGLVSITVDGELQSFSNAIVLYGETSEHFDIQSDATGKNFLASNEELASLSLLPSCHDLIEIISSDQQQIFELHYAQ